MLFHVISSEQLFFVATYALIGLLAYVSRPGPGTWRSSLCAKSAIVSITSAIYNVYLHPLAKFPGATHHKVYPEGDCVLILIKGPLSRAAFHFWDCWSMLGGNAYVDTQKLHDTYGPVVRIMPNALSFNTAQAWKGTAMPQ